MKSKNTTVLLLVDRIGNQTRKIIQALILSVFVSACYSQQSTDYKSYRDSLNPTVCGLRDSVTLVETINRLEGFDSTGITQNMTVYYNDLSDCYWELSNYDKSESGKQQKIRLTIENCEKALYHAPQNTKALWNVVFASSVLMDCERVQKYLPLYKSSQKRKYWMKEELKAVQERCPSL